MQKMHDRTPPAGGHRGRRAQGQGWPAGRQQAASRGRQAATAGGARAGGGQAGHRGRGQAIGARQQASGQGQAWRTF